MLFMTSTKKGMSACEIKRQMGHTRYNTVLSVMNRMRDVMGKRDSLQLNDMVELDEGFLRQKFPAESALNSREAKVANGKKMWL